MFDAVPPVLQRSRGDAAVRLSAAGAPRRLRQAGSAKAFLPRAHGPHPEVVFLNTAGGLAGGDRLSFALALEGGRAAGTTQTAERAYRSAAGAPAEMAVTLEVGPGGRLDWLPQETILYDGAALRRRTEAVLAADASLLIAETLVLGRAAMGETVRRLDLCDRRSVARGGRPVWVEPLRIESADLAAAGPAGLGLAGGAARALSTIAFLAQGAEDALGPVRRLLGAPGVEARASAWDGRLVVRLMAADPRPLRAQAVRVLTQLRGGPMPRVWQI